MIMIIVEEHLSEVGKKLLVTEENLRFLLRLIVYKLICVSILECL